jgi:hypothetical protein
VAPRGLPGLSEDASHGFPIFILAVSDGESHARSLDQVLSLDLGFAHSD